jgi:hypothetical protein
VREVRARLLGIPPLVADMIRQVVTPRAARSGVRLTLVVAAEPPPDLVIASETAELPAGITAIVLSADFSIILGGDKPAPLTPGSLARQLLEKIRRLEASQRHDLYHSSSASRSQDG